MDGGPARADAIDAGGAEASARRGISLTSAIAVERSRFGSNGQLRGRWNVANRDRSTAMAEVSEIPRRALASAPPASMASALAGPPSIRYCRRNRRIVWRTAARYPAASTRAPEMTWIASLSSSRQESQWMLRHGRPDLSPREVAPRHPASVAHDATTPYPFRGSLDRPSPQLPVSLPEW